MHVTPVQEAADLSVTGVAFITHFMFSAFFSVIYRSCNTFSRKQSLFSPLQLRAAFSLLPCNSWSRLPSPAWPEEQGSRRTTPNHFHLQNRGEQSLGTPEGAGKHRGTEKTHPCRDWGCAVSVLLSPRMVQLPSHTNPAWWFHNDQPKAGLSTAQSTGCTTTKWPLNALKRSKRI